MKSDPIFIDWVTKRNLSENTIDSYRHTFEQYINYLNTTNNTNYTLTDLLKEAEEDERSGEILRYRRINKHIVGFIADLKKKGKGPSTINNRIAAIESFYKTMNIQIPFIERNKGDTVLEKNQNRKIKRNEIRDMVEIASTRNKAIIYTMTLTGMAQNELTLLTIQKFADSISNELNQPIRNIKELFESEKHLKNSILTLHLRREKINYRHFTFIPPESHSRIFAYLKTRLESNNPNLHPEMDSYLFVNRSGNKLSRRGIIKIFTDLGDILQLQHQKGSFRYFRSHSLRKYFISTIYNKTGDLALADYLAGHKPDKVQSAYVEPDEEDFLERYKIAYPYLSIDNVKVKDFQSKEYLKLEMDNQSKNDEINALKEADNVKTDELIAVRKEQAELRRMVGDLLNKVED